MQRDEITNKVKCQLCSEEFDYPLNGFKENQRLKQIIENDQHLSNEREKTLKKTLKDSSTSLEMLANDFKPKELIFENKVQAHYEKLKANIDERKLFLINKIEHVANCFLDELLASKEKHISFTDKLCIQKSIDDIRQLNDRLLTSFSNPELDLNEIETCKIQQEKELEVINNRLCQLDSAVSAFESIEFVNGRNFENVHFGGVKQPIEKEKITENTSTTKKTKTNGTKRASDSVNYEVLVEAEPPEKLRHIEPELCSRDGELQKEDMSVQIKNEIFTSDESQNALDDNEETTFENVRDDLIILRNHGDSMMKKDQKNLISCSFDDTIKVC